MRFFKYCDKLLIFITLILVSIGTIMIFSASNVSAYMRFLASAYNYLIRQIIILVVCLFFYVAICFLNVKFSSKISSFVCYLLLVPLLLLFVFGKVTNNAQSWFKLGRFLFQPSEFFKVAMVIWLACYYSKNSKNLDKYTKALYPVLIFGLAFATIVLQPDLGTALILLMIFAFMFVISPISKDIKKKIYTLGFGMVFLVGLLLLSVGNKLLTPTQMSRITSVVSGSGPCSEENYYTDGNQVCNGYIAINNGGLTGLGLGNSIQKYLYLPEAHTDFIFCIIVEELGLLMGVGIIVLYIILIARIIHVGNRALNDRDAMICYGGAFYIFIHIMINLMGIFGLIPMTGVPLPFMSYGGSYLISLTIMMSIIERISYENNLKRSLNKGK